MCFLDQCTKVLVVIEYDYSESTSTEYDYSISGVCIVQFRSFTQSKEECEYVRLHIIVVPLLRDYS